MSNEYKSVKEISECSELSSTIISNNLREIKRKGYVNEFLRKSAMRNGVKYFIDILESFLNCYNLIDEFEEMSLNHSLKNIPDNFLVNLGYLESPALIKSVPQDIYKAQNISLDPFLDADEVLAIFSKVDYGFTDFFDKKTNKSSIKLITSEDVFEAFESKDYFNKYFCDNTNLNFEIFVLKKELDLKLLICDNFCSIGLFFESSLFDTNLTLISESNKATGFHNYVFIICKLFSEKVKINNLPVCD